MPENEHEAADTIPVTVSTIHSLLAIALMFIGGIAWGVRLESRTENNSVEIGKTQTAVDNARRESMTDHDKVTRLEQQVTSILEGITEIKGLLQRKLSN